MMASRRRFHPIAAMPETPMIDFVKIAFASFGSARPSRKKGRLVIFVGTDLQASPAALDILGPAASLVATASAAARFKGKTNSSLDLIAPAGLDVDRLLIVGVGADKDTAESDYVTLGGFVMGKLNGGSENLIVFDFAEAISDPATSAADFTLGMMLRAYRFELYKTKKSDDAEASNPAQVTIAVADPASVRKIAKSREAVGGGVAIARDLVNEPPNVLHPEEFARRAAALEALGVEIEILDEKALAKLGMRALLGVGQGSNFESRVVIMRWNGAKHAKDKPVAFVGKGVCFDTGGISIKPAQNMEDMKGDMAGAACVTGLMHALASRRAKVNAVGAIGLVENMPGGGAQRPGDIVKSMSGQTIEIINTDAEGRLVLADVLWHIHNKFKPAIMIDLATLTGAILVALGNEHAGMFSNNDALAEKLVAAGKATGEKVWRMPLSPVYDKIIDSKFADVKNSGGRYAGSITAAQFLQRFVGDTPWAHLDIAGTGMGSPATEINQSWGSGWGVRLLDRLVADHFEG
jgi:leucyl aminopeptidase